MKVRHVLTISMLVLLIYGTAFSDGAMFSHRSSADKGIVVKEPEQQAVVLFTGSEEQLIISPTYKGPAGRFAWVIPVPTMPKVDTADMRIFNELKTLLPPKAQRSGVKGGLGGISGKDEKPAVEVLERKTIGGYDMSVIKSADGTELFKWLQDNEFHLPQKARSPIVDYVRGGWFFVACKVNAAGPGDGEQTGNLSPIKITFKSQRPIYPVRLSAANPEPFDMLIYVITPASAITTGSTVLRVDRGPRKCTPVLNASALIRPIVYGNAPDDHPALSALVHEDAYVWRESVRLMPSDCRSDLLWYQPGVE
ncbi:MAG: DUF2330 domain-containing protein [Armatimonadota bacterium]